ncbi:GGDEF domain-containing protein [Microvirga terricola]|uniref:diguanylate cyclase n=1 Tax=Microvirga terricola TaxID=2719797 RepID=A0ABX0VD45_9HYPH|nr:GGDEF domain-containing protein [Microvirga terricola]NIX77759.1 GGDEF domain-containing protein [Microvirga terricola]
MSGNQLMTIASPVIGTIFTILLLALWRYQRTYTYILYLAGGLTLNTLATGLQLFFIPGEPGSNTTTTAVFYLFGIALLIEGCLKRQNRSLNFSQTAIILTATLVAFCYYFYVDRSLSARIYILSFGCGALLAIGAYRLRPSRDSRLIDKIIFWIFLLLSIQLILRPPLTIRLGEVDANLKAFGDSLFWLAFRFSLIVGAVLIGLALLSAVVVDITSDLKRQTTTDALTGVYNRRGFDEKASAIIASGRFDPICLVICDIDHFKRINDDHGHPAGDLVIGKLSALLTAHVRQNDIVGRIGGEEFAVLLTERGPSDAMQFSERVRALFEASNADSLRGISRTTASFGIADHRPGETLQQLLSRADRQLYAAKKSGRNRVCFEDDKIDLASSA